MLLVGAWFQTATHEAVCHSDNDLCGNSCAQSATCSCVCASHPAAEPVAGTELCVPYCTCFVVPGYATLPGISVPADIFRPPLTNS